MCIYVHTINYSMMYRKHEWIDVMFYTVCVYCTCMYIYCASTIINISECILVYIAFCVCIKYNCNILLASGPIIV